MKLKSQGFSSTNEAGDSYSCQCDVSVSDKGMFRIKFPDDLLDSEKAINTEMLDVNLFRPKKYWYIESLSLQKCEHFIMKAIKLELAVEEVVENVIRYTSSIKLSYVKDSNNAIYANGCDFSTNGDGEFYKDANWVETGYNASNRTDCFSAGLSAHVFKKVTYIRGLHKKVVYKNPDFPNLSAANYGERLNAFTGLSLDPNGINVKEIPYTEEAAQFFYASMIGLCSIADRIKEFFSDDDNLIKTIEMKTKLLLSETV